MRLASLACAVVALGLTACNEDAEVAKARDTGPSAQAESNVLALSRTLAEAHLRADFRGEAPLQFRGVEAYQQAIPHVVAVCGQVSAQRQAEVFIPFVSLLTWTGDTASPPEIDQLVPMSSTEATRAYVEGRSHCLDGGGQTPLPRRGAPPPLPRIPGNLLTGASAGLRRGDGGPQPEVAVASAPAPNPPAAEEQAVKLTHAGNLRAHPNGGGEVMRVVPRGEALRVFATAPGGWLQVGQTEPRGWLHSSLVSTAAR